MATWSRITQAFNRYRSPRSKDDENIATSARENSVKSSQAHSPSPVLSEHEDSLDRSSTRFTPPPTAVRGSSIYSSRKRSLSPSNGDEARVLKSARKRSISGERPAQRKQTPGKRTVTFSDSAKRGGQADTDDWSVPAVPQSERAQLGLVTTIQKDEHADRNDPAFKDWTEDEIVLFNRLADRGAEPLLPSTWMMDFPTMPDSLFTDDESETFINSQCGKEFNATDALSKLLLAGTRARCQIESSINPAPLLKRNISAYLKWALKDAGDLASHAVIPHIVIAAARPGEKVAALLGRVTVRFRSIAARYRAAWTAKGWPLVGGPEHKNLAVGRSPPNRARPLPTLYGIVLTRTVMTFVTYRSDLAEANLRHLVLFDWGDGEQNVWNAFAVAILIITVRDYLMDLGEPLLRKRNDREGDPDA